jgi:hypothetical protein
MFGYAKGSKKHDKINSSFAKCSFFNFPFGNILFAGIYIIAYNKLLFV